MSSVENPSWLEWQRDFEHCSSDTLCGNCCPGPWNGVGEVQGSTEVGSIEKSTHPAFDKLVVINVE